MSDKAIQLGKIYASGSINDDDKEEGYWSKKIVGFNSVSAEKESDQGFTCDMCHKFIASDEVKYTIAGDHGYLLLGIANICSSCLGEIFGLWKQGRKDGDGFNIFDRAVFNTVLTMTGNPDKYSYIASVDLADDEVDE